MLNPPQSIPQFPTQTGRILGPDNPPLKPADRLPGNGVGDVAGAVDDAEPATWLSEWGAQFWKTTMLVAVRIAPAASHFGIHPPVTRGPIRNRTRGPHRTVARPG